MDKTQFEEIKQLLERSNALAQERLLMEGELFDARKLNLQVSNQHVDAAVILVRRGLKLQPIALVILVAMCVLILYLLIFKL